MGADAMRLSEFPVTEWRGVGIMIRIDHPDCKDSMSYRMVEDSRLMPVRVIRPPHDRADVWQVMEFDRAMKERAERIKMLSEKIASAMIHAMERVDGTTGA